MIRKSVSSSNLRARANVKSIVKPNMCSSCFFRTTVEPPNRKALIQITARCDLHCVHCFVSSDSEGLTISLNTFRDVIIPNLIKCRVSRVTLTGGEPLIHPELVDIIRLCVDNNLQVGVCTNGYSLDLDLIEQISTIGNTHFNVSLDGFRPESHDIFRGKEGAFHKTTENIESLSKYGLLQGLLVTPNKFASVEEYEELCKFAISNGASYVLMNPLSNFGLGVISSEQIGASNEMMLKIQECTKKYHQEIQLVFIRFPDKKWPLSSCETVGNIIYIFANGDLAVCPYLVFAAKSPDSKYDPNDFIAGNIIQDEGIEKRIDDFDYSIFKKMGNNSKCNSCDIRELCGKGCPASIIADGRFIGDIDREVCPKI